MAQSHIKLTGGVGDGRRISNTIQQAGHGFVVGNIVRYNRIGATGSGTNRYELAKADSAQNAEVVGVVTSVVGPNTFVLTYNGEIDTSAFDAALTLADDDVFFLSDTTAGKPVNTPPTSAGSVIKPVLIRTANDTAVITNFVGTVIGGTSVVSLEGIQPVATVEPYAGSIADVPATWSVCDGGPLLIADYPELYDRVGRTYGYRTKLSGISGTTLDQINVGQQITNDLGGSAILSTGVIAEKGVDFIIVDVNHLEADGDSFTQASTVFGDTLGSTFKVQSGLNTQFTGSITNASGQPAGDLDIGDVTVSQLEFRKPDLRGKFVLGVADDASATITALELPSAFNRGEVGGDYTTDASGSGSLSVGGDSGVSNLPPYQSLNWIIKTTPRAKAALLDNLVAAFKLSDLADVNAPEATAQSGDIIVYDATSPDGAKYRPYRLFSDYPDDAENTFQVNMSGGKPSFRFGDGSLTNGFNIGLAGLQSQNFQIVDADSTASLIVDNTSVKIGSKGLKFSDTSAVVTGIRKTVRGSGSATDTQLVTEQGIREAIPTWSEVDLTSNAGPFSAVFTDNTTITNNSSTSTAFVSMGIRSPSSGDGRVRVFQNGERHDVGLDGSTALTTFITVPIGPGQTFRAAKRSGTINTVRVTWMQ